MCAAYYAHDDVRSFFVSVYTWMSVALGVTALTAVYVAYYNQELLMYILQSPFLLFALVIAQLGLVVWLSARIMHMSFYQALALLLAYSMLNGITFSAVLLAYTAESVVSTFAVTALMFTGMAVVGKYTRVDITAAYGFLIMAVWGLAVSMLVNLYFQNSTTDLIISCIGVLVFSALTAVDTRRLMLMAQEWQGSRQELYQVALAGALTLYLDFINLFLMLLRFTGNRRNS